MKYGTLKTTNFISALPAGARLGSMAESFQLTIIGAAGSRPPRHCKHILNQTSIDFFARIDPQCRAGLLSQALIIVSRHHSAIYPSPPPTGSALVKCA